MIDNNKKIRTRFAPSPTGFMHIGNLRSALFEYLVAKHENGDFILRIEDTDQTRQKEGAVEFIYKTLELCNLNIDEGPNNPKDCGPYIQSERKDIYLKYAEELVEKGEAYYCFCNEERLQELREEAELMKVTFMYDGKCKNISLEEAKKRVANNEPYVIRQKMPKEGITSYEDLVYGKISVENKLLEDQILIKSDGFPTYNFANVIDDHLMNITHVVRGNEYLSSTPKYLLLYKSFGWESPVYIHLPHIIREDGHKLSKRNGDASFMDLYNAGYLPEAIVNYLALLGWTHPENKEIFTLEELTKDWDSTRINKSPAVYDIKKLRWINSHYIKKMPFDKFKEWIIPFITNKYSLDDKDEAWINRLLEIYQQHISYAEEIIDEISIFFNDNHEITEEAKEILKEEQSIKTVKSFKKHIEELEDFTEENIVNIINKVKEETGNKGKSLFMPIRIASSGLMHGPELSATIYLLGKEKVLKRLNDENL